MEQPELTPQQQAVADEFMRRLDAWADGPVIGDVGVEQAREEALRHVVTEYERALKLRAVPVEWYREPLDAIEVHDDGMGSWCVHIPVEIVRWMHRPPIYPRKFEAPV